MLAFVGILVGEVVEYGTPLYGDKIVGTWVYYIHTLLFQAIRNHDDIYDM